MEILAKNTKNNKKIIELILNNIAKYKINIVLLKGELGAGKTTLTSDLVHKLGFINKVSSPTFVIEKIYNKKNTTIYNENVNLKQIHHLDLYRLTSIEDLEDIGLLESINQKNVLFIIEWPEIVEDTLNKYIKISIDKIEKNKRLFKIEIKK